MKIKKKPNSFSSTAQHTVMIPAQYQPTADTFSPPCSPAHVCTVIFQAGPVIVKILLKVLVGLYLIFNRRSVTGRSV